MDLSWESAALLSGQHKLGDLPTDLLSILRRGSNLEYIETVSNLALDPKYATTVFFTHEQAFVEIASRWLNSSNEDGCSALASLARILPAAPHLSTYAKAFFKRKTRGALAALASRRATALQELPKESLHTLLLALCRLMLFDEEDFAEMISPVQLQMLLKHQHLHIRYLAIRLLCLYLHASDGALASMINTYTGEGEIAGEWEEKTIDYTFFSLWEEKRLNDLELKAQKFRHARERCHADGYGLPVNRIITPGDLSGTTACICGILIPRLEETSTFGPRLVMTETITKNMRALAEGVNTSRPLLVTGCAGSGKSSVVRSVAQELGKSSSMLTLHLNEQTDAKLLIGMYASATKPGSFSWRPGVLTTAVMEGRWLIIEDLDRAPTDIISILLPLLERRELLIPHWGKTIRASPSFKILATVRSTYNTHGDEIIPVHKMIGIRHWLQVAFQRPSLGELAKIVGEKFHILQNYIPRFMDVYSAVVSPNHMNDSDPRTQFNASRQLGSQDLLRWCGRVENVLLAAGVTSSLEPITEAINDQIFLEAVDCFVGALPSGFAKTYNIDTIAQKLHMSAERVNYCLTARQPAYQANENSLQIGRIKLAKQKRLLGAKPPGPRIESSPFAMTNQVLRIIESVSVAVKQAEPCLLVGETGTGKTTIVQRLADKLNRKLTVVNLSQQSEAGDLLGGYKPVNLRSLAVPMKEEFDELLEMTFPSKRNQHYTETIGKSVTRGRWERALALWQEALRMIKARLNPAVPAAENTIQEPLLKKRKMQSLKIQKLRNRWDKFASDLQTFQMHLTSGSKGFAFSFVEGNIVKAARNGDWVLLDEINLASSDTLESLAELFSDNLSGGPSVLLTDTGDAERIRAHQDFRVFGAMNPANDVGKRDLPISLRSNFTEIYVDAPDKDFDNLVAVVKAYIGNQSTVDLRVATDIAYLYLEIKKLADENRLVDGADQKPHFSLRTLTRTLIYALDIAPMYGFRRALFEGFSMSFLTVLDRDSELLVLPLIEKHILGSHKNSKAALYQTPRLPQDGKKYVQFRHYWIVQGAAEIEEQPNYIITPFIEHNLLNLVRATSTRRFPVLLQGPTSSGKTSMIEHLARISGNKFVRINNHEHTDLQEYLGTYVSGPDGRLQFHEGILVNALREGHWVVLDELNLAPTDVLEALNRLLDDNRELLIPETQQVVRPHQNFMLFATQNPPGMYGGRKTMSRAFRNRFLELHFDDIPEDELETILRERSQIAPSFCARIVAVYKKLSILRQSERLFEQKNSFATLRDLFRWALRDADDREQLAVNGFFLLAERVRNPEERLAVKTTIEEVMKVQINEGRIYTVEKIERLLGSPIPSQGDIVLTRSMRRLFVLVTEALRNNEPVLLIGETGSGKTTICQVIAKLMNLKLHIVNAHQNMETSDLIGAQRPIRNRASVESQLVQELMAILRSCDAYEDQYGQDIVTLQAAYEALQFREPAKLPDEARFRIEKSRTRANALFEWTDGSLVHAMQNGHHFLLDEISLADDSVLERLNSVLEPDRALFLAEKGSNDALVTASPGFQFLATMNPGGDYGKRELSPALRNRFTEIWVPRASSEDEMMEIAQAKLVPSQAEFAKPMVEFASWHAAKYDILSPHISIRDLLSWIYFVNTALVPDAYLALLHGAAMVYIDGLGANPASRMSIPETAVSQERQICLLKFDTIFDAKVSSSYSENRTLSTTSGRLTIGPFHLLKASHTSPDLKYSMQAPTTLVNAMKIVRALQIRKPILLEGSPGVGKTTIVAALAQAIGTPLTRINLSDQTDLMDLFGSDVPIESEEAGHFGWSDAPFLRAMQNGEWVLLDEMNLASQTVLEGLNACLDHRGQVYISELDRTFDKHPDFVVFAAQNPYHQGGGRKGLPASFVDRFTVVYADNFTPKDLLMISKEVFPTAPSDAIELILRCFTALSGLIQQDRRVGSNGGPWEINLRDILRWLHLLTSQDGLSPMASSTSYQDLLFLQRFRTSEEAAAVSEILRLFLPNHKPRSYFQSKSDDSVEIGLGLLPRGNNSLVVSRQRLKTAKINPALAESVMLCVHNNWPCLLVGPPGSGKTTLILQLASCVGADVVELSLNSEIDTMDLVGGYEQWDPTREIAGFVKRLREYTKNTLLQQLASAVEPSHSLLQLDTNLRVPAIRLPEALRLIGKAVEDYPSSDYSDFLDQCRSLMQPSTFDSRARFEWVDGILVKALKQGKWLILDNANLCSPSVLDRLNSLLEPNGFLNVNEHRNPDGSAQVVKAHPNFRLFMTMDPCHGELSRAMRNRSIELFFPAQHPSPTVNILRPCSEPKISRFELFRAFDWSSLDELSFKEHLAICFDHLAFPDIKLFTRWQVQATLGLVDSFCFKEETFGSVARAYQQMFEDDGFVLRGIRDNYARLARTIGLSADFSAMQVSHLNGKRWMCFADSDQYHNRQFIHSITKHYFHQ